MRRPKHELANASPRPAAAGEPSRAGPRSARQERLLGSRRFWIAWTGLAVLTLALTLGAHLTSRYPGDVRLAQTLQSLDVPVLGGVLHLENTIGSPWPAVTIIAALTLALFALRRPGLALLFAGTNALRGVGSIVKDLVLRPRPAVPLVHVREHASGTSFPSGHVFSAVLLYGMLAVLLELAPLPRPVRRGAQGVCLAIVLLMGPARVYVGAHWPSDVLGGYLWGTLLLLLVLGLRRDADRVPRLLPPETAEAGAGE